MVSTRFNLLLCFLQFQNKIPNKVSLLYFFYSSSMIISVPPETFLELARDIKGMPRANLRSKNFERNYRTLFGVSPLVTSDLWNLCSVRLDEIHAMPKHLLWSLAFINVYATEDVMCSLLGCDRKTFRKWVWPVLDAIASKQNSVVSKHCSCLLYTSPSPRD